MINKTIINKYIKEFIGRDGCITIEFSEHKDNLKKLFKRLKKRTPKNLAWTAHTCETCEDYHGKGYIHISLHKSNSKYAGFEASNLLCTTKDN